MARSLNRATLIGNTGSDPDVRTTPSGTRVAKVSLATSRSFQDRSGQQQERTQWHRLSFFGRLADVVEQWVKEGVTAFTSTDASNTRRRRTTTAVPGNGPTSSSTS